ncbi:MAG: EamA family transporter [Firmicutes bacterium]|nr:EamA family transporter [Bacillota bacterium]
MSLRAKALTAVIAGNTIFGFSFLFSKVALQMTVPGVLLAARFLTAFAVLNIIVIFGRLIKNRDGEPLVRFSLRGKPLKDVLLLALFQPVIYFAAESYGIQFTSSAFAGTIIAVIPVMGVISDVIIMKSDVSKKQIICALASVAGVALTTLGAKGMKSSVAGTSILMAAVVAGALFYVFSKKAGEHFNPLERTYVMFGAGSAVYVCFALIACAGDYDRLITDVVTMPEFWGCIMYLAVASSVIAFIALNYGSSHVSVSEASLFANLTTVISIIAGVAVLHESFTLQQIAGAAVIIASVYISSADQGSAGENEYRE